MVSSCNCPPPTSSSFQDNFESLGEEYDLVTKYSYQNMYTLPRHVHFTKTCTPYQDMSTLPRHVRPTQNMYTLRRTVHPRKNCTCYQKLNTYSNMFSLPASGSVRHSSPWKNRKTSPPKSWPITRNPRMTSMSVRISLV